jgi:hypothetical protein
MRYLVLPLDEGLQFNREESVKRNCSERVEYWYGQIVEGDEVCILINDRDDIGLDKMPEKFHIRAE